MCSNKTSPVREENQKTRTSTRIEKKKQRETTSMEFKPPNLEASREIRVKKKTKKKKKKPKFLSLKLELNTSHEINQNSKTKKKSTKQSNPKTTPCKRTEKNRDGVNQNDAVADNKEGSNQYDIVAEKEGGDQYDNVAAYLFNSGTDSTISSIHDLLHSSSTAVDVDCGGTILSPYDHKEHGNSSSSLLRTAMRKGASEEDGAEERWVSYSEVVEEVMSRSGTPQWCGEDDEIGGGGGGLKRHSLTLKLDYEQIMEAWSDKGTLYVDGEPPQTVPDLHAAASADGVMDGWSGGGGSEAGNIWAVPEMEPTAMLWRGHREASLLRYKEKRQNRLFSKRIRYQVRKLNAEKRPRIKGRFVKRDDP